MESWDNLHLQDPLQSQTSQRYPTDPQCKPHLDCCSLLHTLKTKNTSQMNFPTVLTAEIITMNSNLAKCTPQNNIYSLDNSELWKMYFIIIVVFQISSVKILCIFVFSCCGYNHPRIVSQPAKSKILIMWPLFKKEKELANPCHRLKT